MKRDELIQYAMLLGAISATPANPIENDDCVYVVFEWYHDRKGRTVDSFYAENKKTIREMICK